MQISKPVLVLLGMMGRMPFAGVAWQVLHYLEGFRRLGYDVYYIEDTGDWPYDPEENTISADPSYTVRYIAHLMDWCGLAGHWAYRSSATERSYGLSEDQVSQLLGRTEILVNLSGATMLREEHFQVAVRVYLETDPVLPQIEIAQGRQKTIDLLAAHTHHFSYGENFGAPDCRVPVEGFCYRPTRQPVVVEWWTEPDAIGSLRAWDPFTTVANWRQTGKDIVWQGETYAWSKHHEFMKFIELPAHTTQPLELALAIGDAGAPDLLKSHGWSVVDAMALSRDLLPYREYIRGSRGEFTVAKDQNIRLRSGWFSDRSASYLAAGRPVVTQDTGFGAFLPIGEGLFAFRTMEGILAALETINGDYERQRRAAREIAGEYFRAEVVLTRLIDDLGG